MYIYIYIHMYVYTYRHKTYQPRASWMPLFFLYFRYSCHELYICRKLSMYCVSRMPLISLLFWYSTHELSVHCGSLGCLSSFFFCGTAPPP